MLDLVLKLGFVGARGAQSCAEGALSFICFDSRDRGGLVVVSSLGQSRLKVRVVAHLHHQRLSSHVAHFHAMASQQHLFRLRAPPEAQSSCSHACAIAVVCSAKAAMAPCMASLHRAASSMLASLLCLAQALSLGDGSLVGLHCCCRAARRRLEDNSQKAPTAALPCVILRMSSSGEEVK